MKLGRLVFGLYGGTGGESTSHLKGRICAEGLVYTEVWLALTSALGSAGALNRSPGFSEIS